MKLDAVTIGQGPPVCLLHGLFGRARNLAGIAATLAATHRVVLLDLRNHGASPHQAGMAYADQAADVLDTLAGHGVPACALLGHSMGGKVAMTASLVAPGRVSALVVADIAPRAYSHDNVTVAEALRGIELRPGLDRRTADAALASAVPDAGVRAFLLQNLQFGPDPHWKVGLDHIAMALPDIEGWTLPSPAARYDGPALFVAGALSDYVPPDSLGAIRTLFPRAALHVLPQAGHWLHADQPAAFAACVSQFLAAVAADSASIGARTQ